MKILIFSHYFPPEVNAPASRIFEHAKFWVEAGHEVTVITCAPNCPEGVVYPGYKNKLYQREDRDGIDVRRVWTFLAANEGTFLRSINYISYLFSALAFSFGVLRPDVVIATSPQFFCGWAGVMFKLIRRVPFVLEIRDLWPDSILAVGALKPGLLLRMLEWMEKVMYRAADHIVTIGPGYRQKLIEKGVTESGISILMNGVDESLFYPRPPDPALRHTFDAEHNTQGRFLCSYIGTVGMACGLEVVLDAAERLKKAGNENFAFLIVGEGANRAELEKRALNLGLEQIIFVGRQPHESIPDLLALSDAALVHLKKTDLFKTVMPSKIFEAAAMACPIINGVEGYAAEFIDESGAGLNFRPEDPESLIGALERLARDPELCARMGKQGRLCVESRFKRRALAGAYLELLIEMTGLRPKTK